MEELPEHKALNILMISDTIGGVWTYSVELCKALLPFNVNFHLVTTGAALQSNQKKEIETLKNVTIYETDFLLEWMDDPWANIDASANWLLQLEEELQPHIIHINGYVYGSLAWKAPKIIVAHSDVFSWFYAVRNAAPPKEWNEYFNRVREGLNAADYLIAPSKWMMQVREIYETPVAGKVIYNGRSNEMFQPKYKNDFVFSMGRIWDEAKNIKLLVEASSQINYSIKLAGDFSFENNSTATESSNISYLGKLSAQQIAEQLSAAAVYVMPAKYEPFGLSVLEAALSGCALVLGNIDSLKEIWGEAAIYIDTDDANLLAETVNKLMKDESLRKHYAQAAIKQAKKYSVEVMGKNYLQMYEELTSLRGEGTTAKQFALKR